MGSQVILTQRRIATIESADVSRLIVVVSSTKAVLYSNSEVAADYRGTVTALCADDEHKDLTTATFIH